jgi:hypothetical protein
MINICKTVSVYTPDAAVNNVGLLIEKPLSFFLTGAFMKLLQVVFYGKIPSSA